MNSIETLRLQKSTILGLDQTVSSPWLSSHLKGTSADPKKPEELFALSTQIGLANIRTEDVSPSSPQTDSITPPDRSRERNVEESKAKQQHLELPSAALRKSHSQPTG